MLPQLNHLVITKILHTRTISKQAMNNSLKSHVKDGLPVSVLLIGAGGAFGRPLLQELIKQKDSFENITILAPNEEKAAKFASAQEAGIAVRTGSFLEPTSYKGSSLTVLPIHNIFSYLSPKELPTFSASSVTPSSAYNPP